MKKPVQIDWLSTWFKPRIRFVTNNAFIDAVKEIESQGGRIQAWDVKPTGYVLHITDKPTKQSNVTTNEAMEIKGTGKVKG